ncbi:hypothetical protein BDV25DRAFT_138740 [Aspergillus avenaceus]|uniref:Alcohol dehydrogenase-like C-terminal domain-containing protein n=1 Tax=Aspergillus avenaceus TaxID=36643 RepID=A0A5N6TZ42_ASPAV|nr:hypothetical protein BDV25DRAFT_138740 [Aspergillus avenaceus]
MPFTSVKSALKQILHAWSDGQNFLHPRFLALHYLVLPCAAVTDWNALYGGPKGLKAGETVLTPGSGGVTSMFASQIANIGGGGVQVISTTRGAQKADRLKRDGADRVIHYREDEEWGNTAKKRSRREYGADLIVGIGGVNTMVQSTRALATDGQIAVIGRRAGAQSSAGGDNTGSHSPSIATIRRVVVGSRQFGQFAKAM